ncbi:MAG: hypothetical protein K6D03_08750 [Solobacterium sp.]|nr:hypothetical protein [Solobacterium sp.]
MNRRIRMILTAAAVLVFLYFMPFVTTDKADDAGRKWRVPFGMWFTSSDDSSVTFSSIRSGYALTKDAENALQWHEEHTCYGTTYYYDKAADVSLTGYTVENGIPSRLTFTYEHGNACAGWTVDDEIAWEIGDIHEIDFGISTDEAVEKEWLVIRDGKALDPGVFNNFARLCKQGVFGIMRTMIIEGDSVRFIDIQNLENAKYRIAVNDGKTVTENIYSRFSDERNSDETHIRAIVTEGSFDHQTEETLFEFDVK